MPTGQHVIVTGASSGIGRATALRFAREGASVLLVGRAGEALAEISAAYPHAISTGTLLDNSRRPKSRF